MSPVVPMLAQPCPHRAGGAVCWSRQSAQPPQESSVPWATSAFSINFCLVCFTGWRLCVGYSEVEWLLHFATGSLNPLHFAFALTRSLCAVCASALKPLEMQFKVNAIFLCLLCWFCNKLFIFVPYLTSYYSAHSRNLNCTGLFFIVLITYAINVSSL